MEGAMKTAAITIDVEDWFQSITMRPHYPIETWSDKDLTLIEPLTYVLDTLAEFQISATFFVLGWFAEYHPRILHMILDRGHEIASHGMTHKPNNLLDDEALQYEILQSKLSIEKVIGRQVLGYRAASFSISARVLEVVRESGYKYDSSLHRARGNSLYGDVTSGEVSEMIINGLKVFEIPTGKVFGLTIPFSGGTYFRMLPFRMLKHMARHAQRRPLILYFHPCDFDPRWLRMSVLPMRLRVRGGLGASANKRRFREFIRWLKHQGYSFKRMKELI